MQVPLAIDGDDAPVLLKLVEQRAEALGPEGRAGAKVGGAEPRRSRLAQVLLDHLGRRAPSRAAAGASRERAAPCA